MPPNRVTVKASYFVRGNVIFLITHSDGETDQVTAFRVTSPTTMDSLKIILSDGSDYGDIKNMKEINGHFYPPAMPDLRTVKVGQPDQHFVRCGDEAEQALAKVGITTANANAARARAAQYVRHLIASNNVAQVLYELQWASRIEEECHYLGKSYSPDSVKLLSVIVGTKQAHKDIADNNEFWVGVGEIIGGEVGDYPNCNATDTRGRFQALWQQVKQVR
jgi:hypothetical protein